MASLQQLTPASLDEFIQSHRFAAILLWAPWEEIHVLVEKMLEREIANDLRGEFTCAGFDIDQKETWEIARIHNVQCIPSLMLYRYGHHVSTVGGKATTLTMNRILREIVGAYPT